MARISITTKAVEAERNKCIASGEATLLWDTKLTGFGCRITASGKVSWIAQRWQGGARKLDENGKWIGGRPLRITIGNYPHTKIEEARNLASMKIAAAASGANIVADKKKVQTAVKERIQAGTLQECVDAYLKRKAIPGKKHWTEVARLLEKEFIAKFGKTYPVAEVTDSQLQLVLDTKKADAPGVARYLYSALRGFFAWCVIKKLISVSPLGSIEAVPEVPEDRDRILNDKEIKAFWDNCVEMHYPFGYLFQLLLLTGARREEIGQLRWHEIDLDKATLLLPKERTKNSSSHTVHLSDQALAVLNKIPRFSTYVFTTAGNKPVVGHSKAKERLDKLMAKRLGDEADFRIHDLRRTAASVMASLEVTPHVIEKILNHKPAKLVGIYQHYDYAKERKAALIALGNYIEALVSPKETQCTPHDNVIRLVR